MAVAVSAIAEALSSISLQLKYLGNGDAATPMGAIEAFGVCFLQGCGEIASSVNNLADSVRQGCERVAECIPEPIQTNDGMESVSKAIWNAGSMIADAIREPK